MLDSVRHVTVNLSESSVRALHYGLTSWTPDEARRSSPRTVNTSRALTDGMRLGGGARARRLLGHAVEMG